MKHFCLSLFCSFWALNAIWAQASSDASFELNLSYDTIGLEETLTLSYVLHNTQTIGQFTPPDFINGKLIAGPMIGQSMSSINGVVTRKYTYTYVIQPIELGILVLPATAIETEAGWLDLSEQMVTVVAETPMRRFEEQHPMVQRSPFDHPFFQQQHIAPFQDFERLEQQLENMFDQGTAPNTPFDFYLETPTTPKKKPQKERKTYRI